MHRHRFGGGVGVPGGARIIENQKFSMHFHCVDIGVRGRGRPLIHCIFQDFDALVWFQRWGGAGGP